MVDKKLAADVLELHFEPKSKETTLFNKLKNEVIPEQFKYLNELKEKNAYFIKNSEYIGYTTPEFSLMFPDNSLKISYKLINLQENNTTEYNSKNNIEITQLIVDDNMTNCVTSLSPAYSYGGYPKTFLSMLEENLCNLKTINVKGKNRSIPTEHEHRRALVEAFYKQLEKEPWIDENGKII